MNQVIVPCKTEGCPYRWTLGGSEGWVSGTYVFPVVVVAWKEKRRCPICGEEHWYSHNDARDAYGRPV